MSALRQIVERTGAGVVLSAVLLLMLPSPAAKNGAAHANGNGKHGVEAPRGLLHSPSIGGSLSVHAPKTTGDAKATEGLMAFLSMPVLRTRGAQLLMALRLLMALAFHMFMPV